MKQEIKEKLISIVIKQMEDDIKKDYYLSLYDLLNNLHYEKLISYLNEDCKKEFENQLNKFYERPI